MADYEVVIGLEIHIELLTESKVFCSCSIEFGAESNTHVCPVCLGLPGALPVLNEQAVEYAVMAGLALNCQISPYSKFDRKNYFYPDLPKAYQISQYDLPLCRHGELRFKLDGEEKRVGITRVHLEEEAGKSLHSGENIIGSEFSLIDYNRGGIPLIEIVTEPDIQSPEEARVFLEKLRALIKYTGVSDVKMEEGSLRCDANISLRPAGSQTFGTKVEIKNMNSFRSVQRALEYEVKRQAEVLDSGRKVVPETRAWDENKGVTVSMRGKEEAHDYRYFPDPDLVPVQLAEERLKEIASRLPELPEAKFQRFLDQYKLPDYDAEILTSDRALADYYENAVRLFPEPKTVSNWVMGEVLRLLKTGDRTIEDCPVTPEGLVEVLGLVKDGTISANVGKEVLTEMYDTGKPARSIVEEKGLKQISDQGELAALIGQVLAANPGVVAEYKAGKVKVAGFLVGQVMRLTKGKANPQVVNELLQKALEQS